MDIQKNSDIHLKLLLGLPIQIQGIGNFSAPSLTAIANLTEDVYNSALSSILFDKNNLEDSSQFQNYTNFEILSSAIYQDSSFREFFFHGLNLHMDSLPQLHDQGFVYFDELSEDSILTEEKFIYLKKLVKIANNLSESNQEEEKKYDFGTEEAKSFWEKLRQKRALAARASKKEEKINLHSIISAVGWKTDSFDSMHKLNIYQLYNGFSRLRIIDNYSYTMTGIYSGSIDGSNIKLPDIDWANIIKIN